MAWQEIHKNNSKSIIHSFSIINYYALEILDSEGNNTPTQEEINLVENKLYSVSRSKKLNLPFKKIPPTLQKGNILLLEKETLFAYVHSKLLTNLGFRVEHVWNLEECIQKKLYRYDLLILSNLKPSDINQFINFNLNPFIIVLLNQFTRELEEKYIKSGVHVILKKHFLCQEFLEVLQGRNKHLIHDETFHF